MDEPGKHVARKKPDTKGKIRHDFMYMKCPGQANVWRQKVDSWLPKAEGRGGREDWGKRAPLKGYAVSFWDRENVLEPVMATVAQLCEYTKKKIP